MKKGLLVLFMASMLVFAENQNVAKKHDKTAKLEKDSYCTVPKSQIHIFQILHQLCNLSRLFF